MPKYKLTAGRNVALKDGKFATQPGDIFASEDMLDPNALDFLLARKAVIEVKVGRPPVEK